MGRYVNPFTDQGFKMVFGQEAHKELLIDFLNELLKGERQVEDITYIDKEIQPERFNGRVVIFDILCKEKDGTSFLVEMQNQYQDYFLDRGLYYLCRMINNQGLRGKEWNYELYPVYGIYFLNFELDGLEHFRTDLYLAERETGRQLSNKLRQIYLLMPCFTKDKDECENDFERWLYLLKNMDILERMPFKAQKAVFEKLLDVADVANLGEKERAQYDATLKAYRDYINTVRSADRLAKEKGLAEGLVEGMAKGMAKGLAEGRTKGLAEGLAEANRQHALKMKQKNFPIETIIEITGLTAAEIEAL